MAYSENEQQSSSCQYEQAALEVKQENGTLFGRKETGERTTSSNGMKPRSLKFWTRVKKVGTTKSENQRIKKIRKIVKVA